MIYIKKKNMVREFKNEKYDKNIYDKIFSAFQNNIKILGISKYDIKIWWKIRRDSNMIKIIWQGFQETSKYDKKRYDKKKAYEGDARAYPE